jgi:hypothetical protein
MALGLLDMGLILEENGEDEMPRQNLRIFRDRENPLENMSDECFQYRYRITKEVARDLCALLGDDLNRTTRRSHSLPTSLQVLIGIRYFATGTFQQGNADIHGVHRTTVCKVIHQVTEAICGKVHLFIKFPREVGETQRIKEQFYTMSNFPNIVGAVDGTLIPIMSPSVDEPVFVCRKGYHAINVQAICQANLEFINVVAKFPGSTHDAYIWRGCEVCHIFETGQIQDGWLLGDSGYQLQPWMLTPLANPHGRGEERYNRRHKQARSAIERAFGLLKVRFRCLHKTGEDYHRVKFGYK